jgi:sugar lactone lactonase YvrE
MSADNPSTATPVIGGLYFGECPRWHDGRLWYSDFFDGAVFSIDEAGERRAEVPVPFEPAGLGWLPDGRLLIVNRVERSLVRREPDGTLVTHGTLTPWATWHGNDMVVDATGRAYCGNFGFDLDALYDGKQGITVGPTSVIRVDPDGTSHEAAADVEFPNGTVITPDGRTLIIAESMGGRLTAFDVEGDGTLTNRRVWAPLTGVAPDGICLDAEGCVWVANAGGPECVRVAEGGEVLDRVTTTQDCFACMLGGADRRTLYAVTAPNSAASQRRGERGGNIEAVRVEVPGAGLP